MRATIFITVIIGLFAWCTAPIHAQCSSGFFKTLGGSHIDAGTTITIDAGTHIVLAGAFHDTLVANDTLINFDTLHAAAYLAKFDTAGTATWARKIYGTTDCDITDVAIESAHGDIYVVGNFKDTIYVDTVQLISAGGVDFFVARYNSSGTLLWAIREGGTSDDYAVANTLDASDNVYVTGNFLDSTHVDTVTVLAYQKQDVFLTKFSSSAQFKWLRTWGGREYDRVSDVVTDASSNVFVLGDYSGMARIGTVNLMSAGHNSIFLTKYNSSGTFQWVNSYGGRDNRAASIAIYSGNIYISGSFTGNLILDTVNYPSAGMMDVFIQKISSEGYASWVKTFGGAGSESLSSMAIDNSGNIFFTGSFKTSTALSSTTLTGSSGYDIFIGKCNSSGVLQWAKDAGGTGNDFSSKLVPDGAGNIYTTGIYEGSGYFDGTLQTGNGALDGFLWKSCNP